MKRKILAAILFGLWALPIAAQPHAFGGIEIGSKGVKSSLVTLTRDEEHWRPELLYSEKNNTNIVGSMKDGRFTQEAIAETARAVKLALDSMKATAVKKGLSSVTYFVVGSSGVAAGKNKEDLATSVKSSVGLTMSFISPEEEAEYGLIGCVPAKRRAQSVLIDIGSGNTKMGYWNDQFSRFVGQGIPYGSVSLRDAANKEEGEFTKNLESLLKSKVRGEWADIVQNKPAYTNRNRIFWLGGAAWATHTFTHPDRLRHMYTQITTQDINQFLKRLENGSWMEDRLPKDMTPNQISAAKLEMKRVRDTFTQKDLMAGVGIMKSMLAECNPKAKVFFPVLNSQWLYGFMLKKQMVE